MNSLSLPLNSFMFLFLIEKNYIFGRVGYCRNIKKWFKIKRNQFIHIYLNYFRFDLFCWMTLI